MLKLPLAIFGIDRMIKFHIDKELELDEPKEICGGKVILRKYYNKGAAFGVCASSPRFLAAVQGTLLASAAVCYGLLWKQGGKNGLKVSLGMLLGGGLGNFYDRIAYQYVIDYASFPVPFPRLRRLVFNVADFFIFAGAILTVLFGSADKSI